MQPQTTFSSTVKNLNKLVFTWELSFQSEYFQFSILLGYHLGFLHQDGDADRVVEGDSEVHNNFPISQHADGTQTNVSLPVVKLANKSVPEFSLLVWNSIGAIWGKIELVLDAENLYH